MGHFEHEGQTYEYRIESDDSIGEPWKEYDGHGIISDWTSRAKRPGERILCSDRGKHRYYDMQGTRERARAEGWGIAQPEGLSRKEIIARAVLADFERMRRFCAGDWSYVGVIVWPEGQPDERESLWGIESDCDEYIETDVLPELAGELAARLDIAALAREAEQRARAEALADEAFAIMFTRGLMTHEARRTALISAILETLNEDKE